MVSKRDLAYLRYVLLHKWYVCRAGRRLGLGWWQLLMHDVSKFSKEEWGPYAECFYDEDGWKIAEPDMQSDEFRLAWHYHQRRNPHHWQYWERPAGAYPFRMPGKLVIEMVADWAGAGRVQTGGWDIQEWAIEHLSMVELHPDTANDVAALLAILEARL